MRGLIYYYSGSGNTRLACEAIAKHTDRITFELFDILKEKSPVFDGFDVVGFATWADFFGPPMRMKTFMQALPQQVDLPAFVLNTYGAMSGRTRVVLADLAQAQGFQVIAGHSLHMPENYPPMIKRGRGFPNAPTPKELESFKCFISQLDTLGAQLDQASRLPKAKGGLARLIPALPRTQARRDMGKKLLAAEACIECGICKEQCPYDAISLQPKPVFDQSKCFGCWACYNHCPAQAISTRKIRGVSQYPRPSVDLRHRLLD